MSSVVKIALFDKNNYFITGLKEALTLYFSTYGNGAKFIGAQHLNEADLVFYYFPLGMPSCFCHLIDARNLGRKVLYFSLRSSVKRRFLANIDGCALESGVIYHDMSLDSMLYLVRTELERQKKIQNIYSNSLNCICQCDRLTPREHEILRLISQEMVTKQIARVLGISIKTVSNHKMSVMRKMGFRRNTELYNWLRKSTLASRVPEHEDTLMTIAEKLREEGRQKGRMEGGQEGRQEGEHEAAIKIARAMLTSGLDRDAVMKMTGLTAEDLAQIRH